LATFSFADLSASYPTLYYDLRPQMQRKVPLLRLLPIRACSTGQAITWDVTFDGQAAGAVNIDGGNFLTAAADPQVSASLGFGAYSAPIKVTTKAQWTGSAQNSAAFLQNLINRNMMEAMMKVVKVINQDLYKGSGPGSNQITGLGTAVAATGTYATINQSNQSNWASQTKGNSGSLRSLSLSLIKQTISAAAAASPKGRPNLGVMGSALFDTFEGLFDGTLYTQAGKNDLQWGSVMTNGGLIKATGFRSLYWSSADITFIEDPDQTNAAQTNASNTIYFLNSDSVEIQYLPPTSVSSYMPDQKVMQAVEQDLGGLAGLQFDFRARGRQVYADEFDLTTSLNLVVKDRAACALLADVQ